MALLLRSYRCTQVTGDDYGKRWVTDAYGQIDITRLKSDLDRSGIYLNVLPLFTSGRARLLDNQRLINQFANLERRTFPSKGQDRPRARSPRRSVQRRRRRPDIGGPPTEFRTEDRRAVCRPWWAGSFSRELVDER